ncbi:MAG: hypothetical protein H6R18_414 [Proteobacteria bacterium]|nr:hypothetical protein [Pseudomonadota bacterium]
MPAININKVADIQQHNIQDVVSRGSIKLGDRSYSVTLVDDQIKVHR